MFRHSKGNRKPNLWPGAWRTSIVQRHEEDFEQIREINYSLRVKSSLRWKILLGKILAIELDVGGLRYSYCFGFRTDENYSSTSRDLFDRYKARKSFYTFRDNYIIFLHCLNLWILQVIRLRNPFLALLVHEVYIGSSSPDEVKAK